MEENSWKTKDDHQVKMNRLKAATGQIAGGALLILFYNGVNSKFIETQSGLEYILSFVIMLFCLYTANTIAQNISSSKGWASVDWVKEIFTNLKMEYQYERVLGENQRCREAVEGAQATLWEWDNSSKNSLTIVFDGVLQHRAGLFRGKWSDCMCQDDARMIRKHLEQCIVGNCNQFEFEHRIKDRKGNFRWVITRGRINRERNHGSQKIVGMSLDITDRRSEEVKVQEMALRDCLTGVFNRDAFSKRVPEFIASVNDTEKKAALLFLDLDDFKAVNDTWGHDVGDAFLTETALRLKSCVRDRDMVARLGGDEFAILINEIEGVEEIQCILSRIQMAFEKPVQISDQEDYISVSIGAAVIPDDGRTIETLMKCADTAMYRAKRDRKKLSSCYGLLQGKGKQAELRMEQR